MDYQIYPDIQAEAERIVAAGEQHNLRLRLLGGLAIRLHAPSTAHPALARNYLDIDVVAETRTTGKLEALFSKLGYTPDREFNLLNGASRLLFYDQTHHRQIDVFIGQFALCHRLPVTERLDREALTLPLAELLLTKLQIVQLNAKDLRDICALMLDHPLGNNDQETINKGRIVELCTKDWGLWKTVMLSLDKTKVFCAECGLETEQVAVIQARITELQQTLENAPKSLKWKTRAAIGERLPWYDTPEEVSRG